MKFAPGSLLVVFALGCGASEGSVSHPPAASADGPSGSAGAPSATEAPLESTATVAASAPTVAAASTTANSVPPPAPELPPNLKILVIGDSFAEALGAGLRAREQTYGIKAVLRGEKATFIPEWAGPTRNVKGLMIQEKPSIVVISLGGNELAIANASQRAPKIRELVAQIGSTPCVWVSPPPWGVKDNGLLEVIRQNAKPCRYYDSSVLSADLPRGSDKIHPTADGQKIWADQFVGWLRTERDPAASTFLFGPRKADE